ncbi:MAG: type II toxin-antitoxin system prevent-host-death family antitoxin [Candidatus Rokubacteria bacterium]|nr:type II toxin-antitoxin system prevent-host-death family antitoxin [Candidatus Rokubacteria bacterium]
MRRYSAAQARQRFAEVLDAAERGQPVVIERRGTRFVIEARRMKSRPRARRKSLIERLDPAVAAGEWTWAWKAGGVAFKRRPRPR